MQFSLWQVLVLAVVQGITEFLPISSDGHLVIIAPLLFGERGMPVEMLDLTIALHLGTLGSILIYYRQQVAALLLQDRRTLVLLVLGTIPAVALVLVCKALFGDLFEKSLQSALLAGCMLPVSGLALFAARSGGGGEREYRELHWRDAIFIGIAQATAVLPGLSRSGTTISAGLWQGMTRNSAATFSFLLAIPALAGAGVYEGMKLLRGHESLSAPMEYLAVGAVVSGGVGLVALSCLERVLQRGKLHWFGWYCVVLGVVVIAWQLAG